MINHPKFYPVWIFMNAINRINISIIKIWVVHLVALPTLQQYQINLLGAFPSHGTKKRQESATFWMIWSSLVGESWRKSRYKSKIIQMNEWQFHIDGWENEPCFDSDHMIWHCLVNDRYQPIVQWIFRYAAGASSTTKSRSVQKFESVHISKTRQNRTSFSSVQNIMEFEHRRKKNQVGYRSNLGTLMNGWCLL